MTRLRLVWDPYNHIGNIENKDYPDGIQFTGEEKKPKLSFEFESLTYSSSNSELENEFTDLEDNVFTMSKDQANEVRNEVETFSIQEDDIDKPNAVELESAVMYYASAELDRTSFLTAKDILDTLAERDSLLSFRSKLLDVVSNPVEESNFIVENEIMALYTRFSLDYSYLVRIGKSLEDISDFITEKVSTHIAKAEEDKDIEVAAIIEQARLDAEVIKKDADDYAKVIMGKIGERGLEDARRFIVDRVLIQSTISRNGLSANDAAVLDDYVKNNSFVEPGLIGTYGPVSPGNDIFKCLSLDENDNELMVVLNAHMKNKTVWNVVSGLFEKLPDPAVI